MNLSKKRPLATDEQIKLARELQVDPLIIVLLNQRKITTREEILDFLNPSLATLPNPTELEGIADAVSLIIKTIEEQEEIIIWGDYDVDGISGTALLFTFFKTIGKKVTYCIPDRLTHGYGLNNTLLVKLKKQLSGNNPLLITVDCGISNFEEIQQAKALGYTVIVTDHHELPHGKVAADVIVDPKVMEGNGPFQHLAGVGVAFYLAAGLRSALQGQNYFDEQKCPAPNMKQFLAFVALGTVADMVPLIGMNRTLVRAGFEALMETDYQGIRALLVSCDIYGRILTADDIGFSIAPKINAAGRIGKAEIALKLLVSDDAQEATLLAQKLTTLNLKRKKMTRDVYEKTVELSKSQVNEGVSCIVLEGDFHQGVIGIVASQLVEKFGIPVILFARVNSESGKQILKGSGRSTEGINLFSILSRCEKYIIQFGGHEMAAGLSMEPDNLIGFKTVINALVESEKRITPETIKVPYDLSVPIDTVFSSRVIDQLQLLEPYGEGNRQPIFRDPESTPTQMSVVGNGGGHIKIRFRGKLTNQEGIGFGLGHKFSQLREKRSHTIIYSPMLNRFKKSVSWQVKILSIH